MRGTKYFAAAIYVYYDIQQRDVVYPQVRLTSITLRPIDCGTRAIASDGRGIGAENKRGVLMLPIRDLVIDPPAGCASLEPFFDNIRFPTCDEVLPRVA